MAKVVPFQVISFHTESNFEVFIKINCIARNDHNTPQIFTYPRLSLQDLRECQGRVLDYQKQDLIKNLNVSENELNNIECYKRPSKM